MLRTVPTRPLVLVLAACALAGCGDSGPSDEQQIRATLAEFERATAARDYQALCDRVFAPKLIETVKQIGLPCEVALEKGFEDVRDPRLSVGAVPRQIATPLRSPTYPCDHNSMILTIGSLTKAPLS